MLAIRTIEPVMLSLVRDEPQPEVRPRASIGSRRNPASTQAILDAAAAVLARDGIAGFSVDGIARLARCGKPTVYRWWPDKLALLSDLHSRSVTDLPPAAGIAMLPWVGQLHSFWTTTAAGLTLRAMIAEAQASADGHARLRAALGVYKIAARSTVEGSSDFTLADTAIAQAVFALSTGLSAGLSRGRTRI